MATIPEQLAAATKAHFEAQLALINTLTNKTMEGIEHVIELNANAVKTSIEGASKTARQMSSAKEPQDLMSAATPNTNKALDYSRSLAEIAAGIHAEVAKATEAQVAVTRQVLAALFDEATKNAPAGSEAAIAAMKTVVDNANAGYDQLTKNTKQAMQTLQANINAATDQIAQASEKSAQKGKKK